MRNKPEQLLLAQKIAIQGEKGSFHQMAAQGYFGPDIDIIPCHSFSQLAHCKCHSESTEKLNNVHLTRNKHHPKSVEEAMMHLSHCVDESNGWQCMQIMSFVLMEVTCCHCHEKGHKATNCPKPEEK